MQQLQNGPQIYSLPLNFLPHGLFREPQGNQLHQSITTNYCWAIKFSRARKSDIYPTITFFAFSSMVNCQEKKFKNRVEGLPIKIQSHYILLSIKDPLHRICTHHPSVYYHIWNRITFKFFLFLLSST